MARNETVWPAIRIERRPSAAPRRPVVRRNPAACRAEAEDLLRDLAFVFRVARDVRRSMTRRDAP